ncbi:MAG TPA: helix-turn-helix transcriptional regulator, partial [Lachnospiraceae bacterium]|nr:helix-turn-helix transcriptional regulator [Lachnospiraceae bacterium]
MEEEAVTSKLKKIRKQKKLTLKDMSELTGFSISFLSQMERGISPVTLTSLKKITKALGISMKEIFHEEEASEDSVDIYTRKNPDVRLEGMQRNYKKMTVLSGHFSQRK